MCAFDGVDVGEDVVFALSSVEELDVPVVVALLPRALSDPWALGKRYKKLPYMLSS